MESKKGLAPSPVAVRAFRKFTVTVAACVELTDTKHPAKTIIVFFM